MKRSTRGVITDDLQGLIKHLLGKGFTTTELRLIPYVQYCLINNENIDPRKINASEREILSDWRARGWISGGASDLACDEKFWNAMCRILWTSYVPEDSKIKSP